MTEKEPKFYLHKLFFASILIFSILFFISIFWYAFYRETTYQQPQEAPFASQDTTDKNWRNNSSLLNPSQSSSNLSRAHMAHGELEEWISVRVVEMMTFTPDTYTDILDSMESYFDKTGYADYEDWLQKLNLGRALTQNNLRTSTYVETKPLLFFEGDRQGRYRWVYQIPVVMSYVPANLKTYKDMEGKPPANRRLTVNLQVGRIDDPDDRNKILIERFSATASR